MHHRELDTAESKSTDENSANFNKPLGDAKGFVRLLRDSEWRDARMASGQRYQWLDDFRDCFLLPQASDIHRRAVVSALLDHMEAIGGLFNTALPIEDVHAYFVHRSDDRFYPALVAAATTRRSRRALSVQRAQLYQAFQARLANRLRRAGQLVEAEQLLRDLIPRFGRATDVAAELSRVEYDLAYVHYLRGDLADASRMFAASARTARRGGNKMGAQISRIQMLFTAVVSTLETKAFAAAASRFNRLLDRSTALFSSRARLETTAQRWVMNTTTWRFQLAFLSGDSTCARSALRALELDPWRRQFAPASMMALARARMALLEDEVVSAIEYFRHALPPLSKVLEDDHRLQESLAWALFDFGRALALSGAHSRARKVWSIALQLPKDAGNGPWQALIRLRFAAESWPAFEIVR